LAAVKELNLKTVAFLGRDGSKCAGLVDVELWVSGRKTALIQEGYKVLLHTICELVEEQLATNS
jgi:phosphoheptose isomerase